MRLFFNKIYFAFSKTERWISRNKEQGDFSWGRLLDILVGFRLGISSAIAALLTFLFVKNFFSYAVAIPFILLISICYFTGRYVSKMKWDEPPNKEMWQQFEKDVIVPEWVAIGIITLICSYVCAMAGGILFFFSIFHIYA